MVRLSLKRPPLWSLVLILLAVTGSIAYVLVTGMAHTNNHPAAPDFTMSSSSSSQGIFQGQSGTAQITITSVAGFTGTVNLSMTISPGGANSISASMSQNTLALAADKGNNTTINMSTTSAATISYSVVVVGKSGSLSHQLTVSVTVLSTSRCTPGYICPGVADPLSIAVSQNASTWQVSQMTIYNYGAFYLSVYAYYYTYADESQMSSEYIVNGQMAPNGFIYFQPAQPGVQVYGVTVLWQTPLPPPMYTQNSQLNQSWVSMPLVARENLLLEADVFNSGTNVTLYIRNTGTATLTLASYFVLDSAGDQYFLNNWMGPTINVNALAATSVTIGASCSSCTLTGNPFTFTTGNTYRLIIVTARNNQFPNSITR